MPFICLLTGTPVEVQAVDEAGLPFAEAMVTLRHNFPACSLLFLFIIDCTYHTAAGNHSPVVPTMPFGALFVNGIQLAALWHSRSLRLSATNLGQWFCSSTFGFLQSSQVNTIHAW